MRNTARSSVEETVPGITNYAHIETTVACSGAITPASVAEIKKMGYASIINLAAEREVIPELIQAACTPERLSHAVLSLLNDVQAAEAQRTAVRTVLDRLRPSAGTPSDAAADAVLNVMEQA